MKDELDRFAFDYGIKRSQLVRRYIADGLRKTRKELKINAKDSGDDRNAQQGR